MTRRGTIFISDAEDSGKLPARGQVSAGTWGARSCENRKWVQDYSKMRELQKRRLPINVKDDNSNDQDFYYYIRSGDIHDQLP